MLSQHGTLCSFSCLFIPLADSPRETFRLPTCYSPEWTLTNWIQPLVSRVVSTASLKDFSRRLFTALLIQDHNQWGSWNCHWAVVPRSSADRGASRSSTWWQRLRPARPVDPLFVACLLHLTDTEATVSLKRRWSKASLAFGIQLHCKRQENRGSTVIDGGEHVTVCSSAFQAWPLL